MRKTYEANIWPLIIETVRCHSRRYASPVNWNLNDLIVCSIKITNEFSEE